MKYTFKGGIHPNGNKITADCRVKFFKNPVELHIPMKQHIGAACIPIVKKGDHVLVGQKIGEVPEMALGAPVHSSVSGIVTSVEKVTDVRGDIVEEIVIENDFRNEVDPEISGFSKQLSDATTEEITEVIKKSGIVGMGGAGFPAHVKLSSSLGKANVVIINCVECEPYLTANYRLIVERGEEIIGGTKILLKALCIHRAVFAIEDNKPTAIKKLKKLIATSDMMEVAVMKTKYPQGDERRIINALTGKEMGRGKLPSDMGCVIFNAESVATIYNAFASGLPSIYRVVTVSGSGVNSPSNVLTPIGTTVRELVDFCGGVRTPVSSIINGGPMMGTALFNFDAPITKTTSGILIFTAKEVKGKTSETACIRCGRCVRACPSRLMPTNIAKSVKVGEFETAAQYGALDCIECGSCAYVCPAKIPLLQYIKVAKGELTKKQ